MDGSAAQDLLIAEFRARWVKHVDAVTLGAHEIEEEGVHFAGKLVDPFAGTVRGTAYFSWKEIVGAISGKEDFLMLKEEAAASICTDADDEDRGGVEFVFDADGRAHFASDLED